MLQNIKNKKRDISSDRTRCFFFKHIVALSHERFVIVVRNEKNGKHDFVLRSTQTSQLHYTSLYSELTRTGTVSTGSIFMMIFELHDMAYKYTLQRRRIQINAAYYFAYFESIRLSKNSI